MIERRKALVLMNEISRFVMVLYGVREKDWKRSSEDYGSEGGFAYYLERVNNPSHPEHQMMKQWGGLRKKAEYNQALINQRWKEL